jgi:hypothetical protein
MLIGLLDDSEERRVEVLVLGENVADIGGQVPVYPRQSVLEERTRQIWILTFFLTIAAIIQMYAHKILDCVTGPCELTRTMLMIEGLTRRTNTKLVAVHLPQRISSSNHPPKGALSQDPAGYPPSESETETLQNLWRQPG